MLHAIREYAAAAVRVAGGMAGLAYCGAKAFMNDSF
jgi:hypothetical protein